jgi:hypothetical protein
MITLHEQKGRTIFLQDLTLALRHALDPAVVDLPGSTEETLPTSDRVRADEGAIMSAMPVPAARNIKKRMGKRGERTG